MVCEMGDSEQTTTKEKENKKKRNLMITACHQRFIHVTQRERGGREIEKSQRGMNILFYDICYHSKKNQGIPSGCDLSI